MQFRSAMVQMRLEEERDLPSPLRTIRIGTPTESTEIIKDRTSRANDTILAMFVNVNEYLAACRNREMHLIASDPKKVRKSDVFKKEMDDSFERIRKRYDTLKDIANEALLPISESCIYYRSSVGKLKRANFLYRKRKRALQQSYAREDQNALDNLNAHEHDFLAEHLGKLHTAHGQLKIWEHADTECHSAHDARTHATSYIIAERLEQGISVLLRDLQVLAGITDASDERLKGINTSQKYECLNIRILVLHSERAIFQRNANEALANFHVIHVRYQECRELWARGKSEAEAEIVSILEGAKLQDSSSRDVAEIVHNARKRTEASAMKVATPREHLTIARNAAGEYQDQSKLTELRNALNTHMEIGEGTKMAVIMREIKIMEKTRKARPLKITARGLQGKLLRRLRPLPRSN